MKMAEQFLLDWQRQIESLTFFNVLAYYGLFCVWRWLVDLFFKIKTHNDLDETCKLIFQAALESVYLTTPVGPQTAKIIEINKRAFMTERCCYE